MAFKTLQSINNIISVIDILKLTDEICTIRVILTTICRAHAQWISWEYTNANVDQATRATNVKSTNVQISAVTVALASGMLKKLRVNVRLDGQANVVKQKHRALIPMAVLNRKLTVIFTVDWYQHFYSLSNLSILNIGRIRYLDTLRVIYIYTPILIVYILTDSEIIWLNPETGYYTS